MGLSSERTVSTTGVVQTTYTNALKTLHDPVAMIRLNPLVVKHELHASEANTHIITDKLNMLGFTKMQTYKARAEKTDNGITFHVDAGPVTSTNHWRVKRIAEDEGKVEIVEEANVKAMFLLMPYVASSIRQSHKILLERLTNILEGENSAVDDIGLDVAV